jgi:renal tumor antigen
VNNLREIQALRRLSPHPNIIKLLEVLYDQPSGRLALVRPDASRIHHATTHHV